MGVNLRFPWANPNWSMEEEFIFVKERLLHSIHKITCPAGCICNDPGFRALICEMKKIDATIIELVRQNKIEEALAAGEKLLDIKRRLNISWIYRGYTDVLLFGIACTCSLLPLTSSVLFSSLSCLDVVFALSIVFGRFI